MPAIIVLVALILGYAAQELIVFAGGLAAARATPPGYFEYFGPQNLEVAHGFWSLGTFAVPQFILSSLLAWGALHLLHPRWSLICAFLAGLILCWLRYMIVVPSQDGSSMQLATHPQFWGTFAAIYLANAWHLPSAWASWLGIATGIVAAFKYAKPASAPRAAA